MSYFETVGPVANSDYNCNCYKSKTPTLRTYEVTTPTGSIYDIEAHYMYAHSNLEFQRDGRTISVFAPGCWSSVQELNTEEN